MTNESPIRFTLDDNTQVIVKKVTNDRYDFELIMCNGSRKTFIWTYGTTADFTNRKGYHDPLVREAINRFSAC